MLQPPNRRTPRRPHRRTPRPIRCPPPRLSHRNLPFSECCDNRLNPPTQYIGLTFGQAAHDAGIAQSMGAVGSCFDNAVAETFFATLTKEELNHNQPAGGWPTRAVLRTAIFDYIEGFYNRRRRHSTLGGRSPAQYEADHAAGLLSGSGGDDQTGPPPRASARENTCA